MMRYLMAKIRRKQNALWIQLVYMEPLGDPTWCIWYHLDGRDGKELARSHSKWVALWNALRKEVVP